MSRISLALCLLCLACAAGSAQSLARKTSLIDGDRSARVLLALRRLDNDVIVYRSLGEFEENRILARVPLQTFESDLEAATAEVDALLAQTPAGKFRSRIINALASYRDGLFWWRQIDQPRVVHVSSLALNEQARANTDVALLAAAHYTVAIHWRQAHKYLSLAENSVVK